MKCPNCGKLEQARVRVCTDCNTAYASEDLLHLRQLEYLLQQTGDWPEAKTHRQVYTRQLANLRARVLSETPATPPASLTDTAAPAELPTDQVLDARAPSAELANLNYLEDWLISHKTQVGTSFQALINEVRQQRRQYFELPELKALYEETSRELALLDESLNRIPGWGQAAGLKPAALQLMRDCLQRQAEPLRARLRGVPPLDIRTSELEALNYTLPAIPGWIEGNIFTIRDAQIFRSYLEGRREAVCKRLAKRLALQKAFLDHLPAWKAAGPIPTWLTHDLEKLVQAQNQDILTTLGGRQIAVKTPDEVEVINYTIEALPTWAERLMFNPEEEAVVATVSYLDAQRQALLQPVPEPVPALQTVEAAVEIPAAAPSIPVPARPETPPPPPPAPARPPRPTIEWDTLWEKFVQAAVSGALLRGLLYLGAFMIVVSITIMVVRFWEIFPSYLQAIFIFSVPTAFYTAGWAVRSRLKLPQAGDALTDIGALLVAVDLVAIYQFGGLSVAPNLYWLLASLVCTLVYTLTAWRMKGIFFDYLALLAATSVFVAFTRVTSLPLEWSLAAATAASTLMVFASARLWSAGDPWRDTAAAARYLPQVLIPISLAGVILLPGAERLGQTTAFLLGSASYGLLAWRFPRTIFAHACVWTSVAAIGLGLNASNLPYEWYGAAAAILAVPYSLASRWLEDRLPESFPGRTKYRFAPWAAAFILASTSVLLGTGTLIFDLWAGIAALALLSLTLAGWTYLFRRPLFAALAGGLFIAPFSLATVRLLQGAGVARWFGWLPAAWTAQSLLYLGLAALLRKAKVYAAALFLWVQVLPILAGAGLLAWYAVAAESWQHTLALAALGGVLSVYLLSAWVHDRGSHPGLSEYVTRLLPGSLGQSVFLWLLAFLFPLWVSIAWAGQQFSPLWLGTILAGMGIAYVPVGQFAFRRKDAYRLPFHASALLLGIGGALVALSYKPALMTALYLDVAILSALAFLHRRREAIAAASLVLVLPFQFTLDLLAIAGHAHSVAYGLLASLLYLPVALQLDRAGRNYSLPVYLAGYGISLFALATSVLGRFNIYQLDIPWVGVLTPTIISGLYLFSLYRFQKAIFAWASALTPMLAYGQLLTLVKLPAEYTAFAWAALAIVYVLVPWVAIRSGRDWLGRLKLPFGVSSAALGTAGLALTAGGTLNAFDFARTPAQPLPLILAQVLVTLLPILAALVYRTHWPLLIEPWLAFLPATMIFIGYAQNLFNRPLTTSEFGVVWSGLGIAHLLAAGVLDKRKTRYAHGLYLGGYALGAFSVLWTVPDPAVLAWPLGLWVLICLATASYHHHGRHVTWGEVIAAVFRGSTGRFRRLGENAFLWLAAWLFPVWCTLLLSLFETAAGFLWLGFSLPALAYLGLGLAANRLKPEYAWPFTWAAQSYTALALILTALLTLQMLQGFAGPSQQTLTAVAVISVQTSAALFYVLSARVHRKRLFAHLASWLAFFPYTLGWIAFSDLSSTELTLPWMGLATTLLVAGYALDRKAIRYAHGPFLAGYLLASLALIWSLPDRGTNLVVLAWCVSLALASQVLIHYRRHATWDDLIHRLLPHQPATSTAVRFARSAFLSLAVYASPVWLALLLSHNNVQLAWRGVALALIAPLYIAAGLYWRRVKPEYNWSLYSAGYLLTAVGVMVSFEDLGLAIWVLTLNVVVYAVSAYIFRQGFWLYLSNLLIPIITLMVLYNTGRLSSPWVSGLYMGLGVLYFGAGLWFDRIARSRLETARALSTFALPFYAPAYLLSAVSLAVASSQTDLALYVYLAGALFYALSFWVFRESLFLYPAAWLAAVPYYLAMTRLPISPQWLGLGWLPLILAYISLGRFSFHRTPVDFRRAAWLVHPAMPFYLLAYALSISMIALSSSDPLTLTLAFSTGALVYLGSAALYHRPSWLYPGLLAAHLALLSYFTIQPSGAPAHYISLPFLGSTWVVALIGYGFSRLKPLVREQDVGRLQLKLGKRLFDAGRPPSFAYLVSPSWAQPFLVFTLLNIIIWQSVALAGFGTTIILALGFALLLALLAMLWQDQALAYLPPLLVLLAAGARLAWAGLPFAEMAGWFAGIGFVLYLLGLTVERLVHLRERISSPLAVWLEPLRDIPVAVTALALIGSLPSVFANPLGTAASLAFAGALYLVIAYKGRYYRLGYLAVGMLEAAWVITLLSREVREPQFYAIPGGVYFALMGYLENRRGNRLFSRILVGFGLAILLLTSFIQSMDGAQGFPYFLLLLAEGLLAIWWGAGLRQKLPFFSGLGASVLNVVVQVIVLVNVYEVSRWFIILGVGLGLVVLAVFVERRRDHLISQAVEWREALETWD